MGPDIWAAASELAELPGLPGTVQGINDRARRRSWLRRPRRGRGGGYEYHISNLPEAARVALLMRLDPEQPGHQDQPPEESRSYDPESLWEWAARQSQQHRDQGVERAALMQRVAGLRAGGTPTHRALREVAKAAGVSWQTIRGWWYGQNGKPGAKDFHPSDWAAALIPATSVRRRAAEWSEEAWEHFKGLYLVRQAPALSTCYRRVARAAAKHGWHWPAENTVRRRLKREFSRQQLIYLRQGADALDATYPAQQRDRSIFHAMQAVNGDGIEYKPYCRWPDGTIARAKVWTWQDLLSGKILTWRADVSENKDMLRLAFGDLIDRYGIPTEVFIDNTTAAASKWLTGGTPTRYRWKIKDEDPLGIIPQVTGNPVRFVEPGHGQSKPIERAFKDLRALVDRHPKWRGKGTKANPLDIESFLEVLSAEIAAHNAQEGRRGGVCAGRSFDQVFLESYARSPVRKATPEQRRLWLLAAEKVFANRGTGAVVLGRGPQGENRYWSEALASYAGQWVVVRFDPQNYQQPVHVYALDGRYIGEAECTWRAGFIDSATGRAYKRAKQAYKTATKQAAEAKRRMTAYEAIKSVPDVKPPDPPDSKVVSPEFRQRHPIAANGARRAAGHDAQLNDAEVDENERYFSELMAAKVRRLRRDHGME